MSFLSFLCVFLGLVAILFIKAEQLVQFKECIREQIYELLLNLGQWYRKLEDLKVMKRSPDLLYYGKNRSWSTTAYNETYFVLPYIGGCGHFGQVT